VNVVGAALDDAKTIVDLVGTAVTAIAVVVGAVWAYYRFIRDRTYRPRLDVSMACERHRVREQRLLLARVRVKNIGASNVELLQEGTGLRISTLGATPEHAPVTWTSRTVRPLLEQHQWIEPGETVSDDVLVRIDDVGVGEPVLLETRLRWKLRDRRSRVVVVSARQVFPDGTRIDHTHKNPSGWEVRHERLSPRFPTAGRRSGRERALGAGQVRERSG